MRRILFALAAALISSTAAHAAPMPDIVPWGVALDADNRLIVTLVNQGDAPAPDTAASVAISVDGKVRGAYLLRNLSDRSFVAPGGRIAIPTNFRLGGDYRRVGVRVDPGNALAEANERQNMLTRTLRPTALTGPDFRIADLYRTGAGALRIRLVNAGTAAAPVGTRVSLRVIVDERVVSNFSADMGGIAPGAGRDAAPPTPAVIGATRAKVRVLANTTTFRDETDSTNNVREEVLPDPDLSAYDALLADPRIADSIVWRGYSSAMRYSAWSAAQKAALRAALVARENGDDPGLAAPPVRDAEGLISEADAWTIAISHFAHALWLEKNRLTTWRLTAMPADQRDFILNSERFVMAISRPGVRGYGVDGGRNGNVTYYNPKIVWDFLQTAGIVRARQDETVYAASDWMQDHLIHIVAGQEPADVYGYPKEPPVDRILYPLPGQMHVAPGCYGTSGFISALMRAANIPAQAADWRVDGGHRRTVFPSLGRSLVHADDVHSRTMLPTGSAPPTAAIFPLTSVVTARYDAPTAVECGPSRCHSTAEQGSFNASRRDLEIARDALGDYLLLDYARGGATSLDRLLQAADSTGALRYAKPLFTDAERAAIIANVEAALRTAGGGDLAAGEAVVEARSGKFYDAIRRVAP
jgi:hypothetical protein